MKPLMFFGGFTGFCIILIVGIVTLSMILAEKSCESQANKMGFQESWGPLQDCMIQVDGRWILLDAYVGVSLKQ